jgi:hypothetical protein
MIGVPSSRNPITSSALSSSEWDRFGPDMDDFISYVNTNRRVACDVPSWPYLSPHTAAPAFGHHPNNVNNGPLSVSGFPFLLAISVQRNYNSPPSTLDDTGLRHAPEVKFLSIIRYRRRISSRDPLGSMQRLADMVSQLREGLLIHRGTIPSSASILPQTSECPTGSHRSQLLCAPDWSMLQEPNRSASVSE